MAKTKAKRRRKHRGTQAGMVQRADEARGRGRGRSGASHTRAEAREAARRRRQERMDRPPTWRSAATRAGIASVIVAVVLIALGNPVPGALLLAVVALALYIPLGYAFDTFVFRLRQRRKGGGDPAAGASGGGARRRGSRREG